MLEQGVDLRAMLDFDASEERDLPTTSQHPEPNPVLPSPEGDAHSVPSTISPTPPGPGKDPKVKIQHPPLVLCFRGYFMKSSPLALGSLSLKIRSNTMEITIWETLQTAMQSRVFVLNSHLAFVQL